MLEGDSAERSRRRDESLQKRFKQIMQMTFCCLKVSITVVVV